MEKRARRKFTAEYKAEVVPLVRDGGKTIRQVSRDLDLTESAVRHWVKQSAIDAGKGGTVVAVRPDRLLSETTSAMCRIWEAKYELT